MRTIVNVWHGMNTYKKATCGGCKGKIVGEVKILSVVAAQGTFTSVSNYCEKCTPAELRKVVQDLSQVMWNVMDIQQKIETAASECIQKYSSTLEKLNG